MMTSPGFAATQRAVDVLSAPQAQVLACLDGGDQPSPRSCDTDAETLSTAIRLLTGLGLVRGLEGNGGGDYPFAQPLALTTKGVRAARLVMAIGPMPVDEEQPADQ